MSDKPKRRVNKRFTAPGKQAARWLFANGTAAAEAHADYQERLNRPPSRSHVESVNSIFDEIIAKRDDDEGDDGGKYSDRWNNLP